MKIIVENIKNSSMDEFFYIIQVFFQLQTTVFALQLDNFMKQSVLNKGLAAAVTLPIFFLRVQQARAAAAAFP